MRYNKYGDDILIDTIQPDEIGKDLVSVGELVADDEGRSSRTANTTYRRITRCQDEKQIWSRAR